MNTPKQTPRLIAKEHAEQAEIHADAALDHARHGRQSEAHAEAAEAHYYASEAHRIANSDTTGTAGQHAEWASRHAFDATQNAVFMSSEWTDLTVWSGQARSQAQKGEHENAFFTHHKIQKAHEEIADNAPRWAGLPSLHTERAGSHERKTTMTPLQRAHEAISNVNELCNQIRNAQSAVHFKEATEAAMVYVVMLWDAHTEAVYSPDKKEADIEILADMIEEAQNEISEARREWKRDAGVSR